MLHRVIRGFAARIVLEVIIVLLHLNINDLRRILYGFILVSTAQLEWTRKA